LTKNNKAAFPKTAEGVTNWEKVFEDPDSGFIVLVSSARSVSALRDCAFVIISQLFTRKNDQLEVARLTHQLDDLISKSDPSADIQDLSATITDLLRQIKDERILKAQQYLRGKRNNQRKGRRSDTFGGRLARTTYRLINDPKFSIITGGVTFILLLGVLGVIININTNGKLLAALGFAEEASPKYNMEQVKKPGKPLALTPKLKKPITTTLLAPRVLRPQSKPPEMPPAIVLRRVILPRLAGNTKKRPGMVMPIIVLAHRDDLTNVCNLQPVIFDILNGLFGEFLGRNPELTDADLNKIGGMVTAQLNARAHRKAVARVQLVRSTDFTDQAGLLCTIAPEKFLKYLIKK